MDAKGPPEDPRLCSAEDVEARGSPRHHEPRQTSWPEEQKLLDAGEELYEEIEAAKARVDRKGKRSRKQAPEERLRARDPW